MSAPRFSVIVPSFNAADSLPSAIDSVIAQSFSNWELIVADDGSSDNTHELASQLATQDSRIHVIQEPSQKGPGLQRNRGIEQAQGDYLLFLDDDDFFLPGAFEALATRLEQSQPDLLLFGAEEVRNSGTRLLHDPATLKALSRRAGVSLDSSPGVLFWPPSCWSKAYRRDFVTHNALRFPEGSYSDIRWNIETFLASQTIEALDAIVYRYMTLGRNTSITTTRSLTSLWRVTQITRTREIIPTYSPDTQVLVQLVALAAVHLVWGNRAAYRTIPEEHRESFFHDSSAELQAWFEFAAPNKQVSSAPLMPTTERELFTVALLSDNYRLWGQAVATHQKKLRWQRRFDWTRYNLFKR